MRKLLGSCTPGLFLFVALLTPLHAHAAAEKKVQSTSGAASASSTASSQSPANSDTPSSAPATPAASSPDSAPAQAADQAPDEATRKISELVHAGKYAEAQQLTAGLLIAYPNDQRLIRARALIEQLIAQSASGAAAAPAGAPPAQPVAGELTGANLTGMDKVDYNALIDLVRQAQQTTDLTEQSKLLNQFMDQSGSFLQKHPEQMLIWQLRAATAITTNQPMAGYEAGQKLLAGGAAESNDSGLLNLLGELKNKGWLDKQQAETLQASADEDRRQQDAVAEVQRQKDLSAKYTFPVFHVHGISYGYGHLTINEDEVIYVGTDETFHVAKNDVQELKVACNTDDCGFYITPKSGRKYFVIAVTEDAVTNQTDKGKVFLKPSVLGNAFVARWHFVASADNKSLHPPPPGTAAPQTPVPRGALMGNSTSTAARSNAFLSNAAPAPAPSPVRSTRNSAAPDSTPAPSSSPDTVPVAEVSAAAPGMAILHVYRQHQVAGMGVKTEIDVDGKEIAKLANEQVMQMEVPAGKHNISAVAGRIKTEQPLYDFETDAGKEYWVHVEFTNGFITHLKLDVVPAEQAETESKSLKEVSADNSSKKK